MEMYPQWREILPLWISKLISKSKCKVQSGFWEVALSVHFSFMCILPEVSLPWISSSSHHKVQIVCHVFISIYHLRTAYELYILWHVKQVWFLHLCPPNMFFINNLRLTTSPDSPARQELPGLKPCGLNDSSHCVIRGMQRGPHESTAKKSPWRWRERKAKGIDLSVHGYDT